MLWAYSNTKNYVRAENKPRSISYLFNRRIIKAQVSFFSNHESLSSISRRNQHNTLRISQNTSISLRKSKLYPQFRNANTENPNTCFGANLHSAGTQHRNLHQLSLTKSRVTYFILRAHTVTGVSYSQHRGKKTLGRGLEKMQVNGPRRQKLAGRNPWQ